MSLVRCALRVLTVMALRGRTIAGARVHDSVLDPLDDLVEADQAPVLTVATEGTEYKEGDARGRTRLVIELALKVRTEDDSGAVLLGVPVTTADLDMMLDLFEAEVVDALRDPTGAPAGDLWRTLVTAPTSLDAPGLDYSSLRGVGVEGQYLAARQILITVETLLEPVRGAPVPAWLADFLALVATDPEYGPSHGMLAAFAARLSGMPSDYLAQAEGFFSGAMARALGLSALARDETGEPMVLQDFAASGPPLDGFDTATDERE